MPTVEIFSNRNQVDRYSLGKTGEILTIHPGRNTVDKAEVGLAMELTDGNPTGFTSRVASGEYEARQPQIAVTKDVG